MVNAHRTISSWTTVCLTIEQLETVAGSHTSLWVIERFRLPIDMHSAAVTEQRLWKHMTERPTSYQKHNNHRPRTGQARREGTVLESKTTAGCCSYCISTLLHTAFMATVICTDRRWFVKQRSMFISAVYVRKLLIFIRYLLPHTLRCIFAR